jgi:8-oxo-dGTP diphosphatase
MFGKIKKITKNYMNKKNENVLIIFAKKPVIGEVKTRIAKETSSMFAYEFAEMCLIELLNKINKSDYYDVLVAVDNEDDLMWFQKKFSLEGIVINGIEGKSKEEIQSNKFEYIFSKLLGKSIGDYSYKKSALIPMDVPFICEEDIITVFARMEKDNKKFVFGPEPNGGVYLIGIKSPYEKGLFKGVRWSTSYSFDDLIENAGRKNVFSLKLKSDLNTAQDIFNLKDEIKYNCSTLYNFLEKNGFYSLTKDGYVDFDNLSICIPVASNIVRKGDSILIQTRHKPISDPKNTGKLEIPSGLIEKYELAQVTAIRETKEESGVESQISTEYEVIDYIETENKEKTAIYRPFCSHQYLQGDRSYLSLVFVSNFLEGDPVENTRESKNPKWISIKELKKMIKNNPNDFFLLTYGALKEYLKNI